MKTLREYIDQLDEISRRDFLKGVGATAGLAAIGSAKGQTVGAGENESSYAANRALKTWKYFAKDNETFNKWIYDTIYQRTMQFFQYSGGIGFEQAINRALQSSTNTVEPIFLMFYQQVAKDKEDSSIFKALLAQAAGLERLSQQEQQRMIGSMNRVNLQSTAGEFVQTYTDSLNETLRAMQSRQGTTSQSQSWQSDKNITIILFNALGLYIVSKDPTFKMSPIEIKNEIDRFIKKFNAKDYVNSSYQNMLSQFNNAKNSDPKKYQEWGEWYKKMNRTILNDMQKLNGPQEEFKEESVDEAATPDAVARIEQLINYK